MGTLGTWSGFRDVLRHRYLAQDGRRLPEPYERRVEAKGYPRAYSVGATVYLRHTRRVRMGFYVD